MTRRGYTHTTGVDLSQELLDHAAATAAADGERLNLLHADVRNLPLDDGCADSVLLLFKASSTPPTRTSAFSVKPSVSCAPAAAWPWTTSPRTPTPPAWEPAPSAAITPKPPSRSPGAPSRADSTGTPPPPTPTAPPTPATARSASTPPPS
ncbi:class I SAM-dependent methyltransferase [Streptomyces sp. NRRL WC-3626]|uniref:class I SAM-dependent methyltransferase n=1 Tax=Streptomyces sp. NRRL WC-3626 TaxID=1463926 RepID=UPI003B6424AA